MGIGAGVQAGTAAASDLTSAGNDAATTQSVSADQSVGSSGGQSQSTTQTASTEQTATASASAAQAAVNVDDGGGAEISDPVPTAPPPSADGEASTDSPPGTDPAVPPVDTGAASAVADNVNQVTQDASQTQTGEGASSGQSQTAAQTAATVQDVTATADAADDSISPGRVTAQPAIGTNTNDTAQAVTQAQTGADASAAESQIAVQVAPVAQEATASASSSRAGGPGPDEGQPESATASKKSSTTAKPPDVHAARASPVALSPTAAAPPEIEPGGSAGGSGSGVPDYSDSTRSASPKQHERSEIATAVTAVNNFATGSALVAKTLATDLPRAALARGLDGDGAVMMKIAKLLLLVYAGFLMFWFWATRVRWNGR